MRGESSVASQNADKLFLPASVLKLVVVAAAMHHLGPDFRQSTALAATSPPESGVLQGDLVLQGAGDPTWNRRFSADAPHAALRQLALQARQSGLRQVLGDLVVDVSRFPGPQAARGITMAERASWYGAAATAVAIDENAGMLPIAPGAALGEPARMPEWMGPVQLVNRTVMVGQERFGKGTLEFLLDPTEVRLIVRGEYPLGEPAYDVQVSLPQPELRAGLALAEELKSQGIELRGRVRVSELPVSVAAGEPLALFRSAPLSQWLHPILESSHNWYAEMLLRVLALQKTGQGRLELGLELEGEFLRNTVGVPADAFVLEDASGLSRNNLITPKALVAVLRWIQKQAWRDAVFSSMARPGQGTLKGVPELRLLAKTGTLQNTLGLAGYFYPGSDPAPDSTPIVFAVLFNHHPGGRSEGLQQIFELLREWEKL